MDEETQKIIAEQMKALPKDVVEAIVSVDYKTKLQEITKRQRLLIDQAGKLEMEVTLIMIGLEPLADFIPNIQRELEVNALRAKDIAVDVSENIFKPIRDSLQKMNAEVEEEEKPAKLTNSNAVDLNRDQILSEIENPIPNRPTAPAAPVSTPVKTEIPITTTNTPPQALEIRPTQDLVTAKMTGVVMTKQETVIAKPESKLPEITPKTYGSIDPYREPLN